MNNELVTVYITTYNRIELLKRAVSSVQNQSYKNIEIIIVDDGSNDDTHQYLNILSTEHPNISFFVNERNSGACYSRNVAINAAKGTYITGLDDDDYFEESRVSDFIRAWGEKPSDVVALFSASKLQLTETKFKTFRVKQRVVKDDLYFNNYIGNQIFTQIQYLKNINGFDIELPAWQDLECWLRLLDAGDALQVGNHSYISDVSHPHERITLQKNSKIVAAYQHIKQKHRLTRMQRTRLASQLIPYDIKNHSFAPSIHEAIKNGDFMLFCKLMNFKLKSLLV